MLFGNSTVLLKFAGCVGTTGLCIPIPEALTVLEGPREGLALWVLLGVDTMMLAGWFGATPALAERGVP